MEIAGIQKNSFVDFPKKISFVIFTKGCNFNCWYCHNNGILSKSAMVLDESEVFELIKKRADCLDGVVFSGGECTLQKDLEEKVRLVKSYGLSVKIDTNGTRPDVLERLINLQLVDYVAMDLKAPFYKYEQVACARLDMSTVKNSIKLLLDGTVDYEFRTTLDGEFDGEDILNMAQSIDGAKRYYLQQLVPTDIMANSGKAYKQHSSDFIRKCCKMAEKYVKKCYTRGV